MKSNSENLYEIALKISEDQIFVENAINSYSLNGLIVEALDDKDIQKLRTAVKQTADSVDGSIVLASEFNLPSLENYFKPIKSSLVKADQFVTALDMKDPEGIADRITGFFGKKIDISLALSSVMDMQNKVNIAINSVADSLDLIVTNLEGKDIDEEMALSDLDQDKHGVGADQIKSGISKAFKAAKPKGFMAKLGGLLKKQMPPAFPGAEQIGDLPLGEISDEILKLNLRQLKGGAAQAEDSAESAESAEIPSDAISDITTSDSASEPSTKAEKESDPSKEIASAAQAAASTPMTPKDAVSKALDDWESSLSASSKKSLKAKKRNQALKDAVFSGIDKGKKAVERAVAKAVKSWRSDHEETLIKSKRFAKKNFDSLQKMIPQLAAQVLSQANESSQRKITHKEIKRIVYKNLDKKFETSNNLYETWQKNAGLLRD